MAAWMIYAVIVALALSAAGYLAECALLQRKSTARWVWVLAIAASVLLPAIITSVSIELPNLKAPREALPPFALRQITSVHLPIAIDKDYGESIDLSSDSSIGELDELLLRGWISLSSLILIAVALNVYLVKRQKLNWLGTKMQHIDVLISPNAGPAVVGFFSPVIVVPSWLLKETDACQRAVLAHEQSHISARDPQLLAFAFLLLALMPWNFPLWWQIRRLRRAMEVDCDARVLNSGHDLRGYCETLLKVGQRKSTLIGPVAAMSEPVSFLERRMKIMLVKPQKIAGLTVAVLAALSIGMVAIAAQVSPPSTSNQSSSGATSSAVSPTNSESADYVGAYQLSPTSVVEISLSGSQLVAEVNGKKPVTLTQSGSDTFTYAPTSATFKFAKNGQGQVVSVTLNQYGRNHVANKIDDASANAIVSNIAERVKNQQPLPGSDKAIRLILSDTDSSSGMSPQIAQIRAQQKSQREQYLAKLGPVSSYEFEGITNQGWDKYLVRHQNGTEQVLLLLDSNGTLIGSTRHE